MLETIYNKLVRDKIPEIIEKNGEIAVICTLNIKEYKTALLEKLVEESKELLDSEGSLDERSDVGEGLSAIDKIFGWSDLEVKEARSAKNEKRGSFTKRLYLKKTIKR